MTRRIKRARPLDGRNVRLTWDDGAVEIKDFAPLLANNRAFVSLRADDALFNMLTVSEDGDRIIWPGGLSLSAASVARMPNTSMAAEELRATMAEIGFSSEGLACVLGLSRRAVTDYRAGSAIPKHVALAVRYLKELSRA